MLGFIGGTGAEGRGLALRFAMTGLSTFIGSREPERGLEAAENLLSQYDGLDANLIRGGANEEAAGECEIAIICTPYAGHKSTLLGLKEALKGKIVVDVVAPLSFQKGSISAINVEEGSAAQQAQILMPDSKVVGAFQNISAEDLLIPNKEIQQESYISYKAKTTSIMLILWVIKTLISGETHFFINIVFFCHNLNLFVL